MISWVMRPPANEIGENDTWSNSLMSHKGPVSERRRAFFLWLLPIEEADLNENFGLVA